MQKRQKKSRVSGFESYWKTKHLLLLYYKHVLADLHCKCEKKHITHFLWLFSFIFTRARVIREISDDTRVLNSTNSAHGT